MRYFLCVAAILSCSSIECAADWQYTKWGMSPDQVRKASKGKAYDFTSKYSSDTNQVLLAAPFATGPFEFTAQFEFKNGNSLSSVALHSRQGEDCNALENTLQSKYGPSLPEARQYGDFKWLDKKANNLVMAFRISGECVVYYRPLAARGAADGL